MKRFSTKKLCRAGIIAALYVVLTWPLGSLAFGTLGFQIRPAEALTMLPFFYVESIPALYVGCLLANVITGNAWDIGLGSLCSLVAAALTWLAGRFIKNTPLKLIVGGIFPVLVNAFAIPFVLILGGSAYAGYWFMFASLLVTQAVWVYALGIPLYYAVRALRAKGVSAFCDNRTGQPLESELGKAPDKAAEHKN